MARCEIEVRLDDPRAVFRQGETITGQVVVRVDEPVRGGRLTLACEWFTFSEGNPERAAPIQTELFRGEWAPGEHAYEFAIVAPPGPLSLTSVPLSLDWHVVAQAEQTGAPPASAEAGFVLAARPGASLTDPFYFGPQHPPKGVSGSNQREEMSLGSMFVIVVFALSVVSVALTHPVLLLLVAPVGLALLTDRMVRGKIGRPELRVSPPLTGRGDTIEFVIVFEPSGRVRCDELYAELRADAVVTAGYGKSERVTRSPVYTQRLPLRIAGGVMRRGRRYETKVRFVVPEDGPCTFSGVSNRIEWVVAAYASIPRWPDWSDRCAFVVRPGEPVGEV